MPSRAPSPARTPAPAARRPPWLAPLLIAALVAIAYHNGLGGPFVFDDRDSIVENLRIRSLWPPSQVLSGTSRPLVMLTLAVNYALGGLDVRGYHVVNVVFHVLSALTLFAILRRTFASPRLAPRYGSAAEGLALACAALWAAHPLATQAVTYVIQRAESLAALFYLLTLYATIRGAGSTRRAGLWYALAALACALGAASKPLVVSAPLVVLLYDRFFIADSFRGALARRGALYAALAATWGIVAALGAAAPDTAAGLGLRSVSPLAYAATQPGVICHYLRLALWPHPLVLDYDWPLAQGAADIVLPGLMVAALLALTLREAFRLSATGFAGLWFALVLAPSSSLFPIRDVAFEHRMYLPLAAPLALAVVAGYEWIGRRLGRPSAARAVLAVAIAAACTLTIARNRDYRSETAIWSDVVAKRPLNARGHNNLGRARLRLGDPDGAMPHLAEAVRIAPDYPEARNNLGAALAERGRLDDAMVQFRAALAIAPVMTDARANLARALLRTSRFEEAARELEIVVRERPGRAELHAELGTALAGQGRVAEAVAAYQEALRLGPLGPDVHNNLGVALMRLGRRDEAVFHFREALRLLPDWAPARENLDRALRGG